MSDPPANMVHEVEKVEQHLAILKMAGVGPGLGDAVSRALAEPNLFVYGEIVDFLESLNVRVYKTL